MSYLSESFNDDSTVEEDDAIHPIVQAYERLVNHRFDPTSWPSNSSVVTSVEPFVSSKDVELRNIDGCLDITQITEEPYRRIKRYLCQVEDQLKIQGLSTNDVGDKLESDVYSGVACRCMTCSDKGSGASCLLPLRIATSTKNWGLDTAGRPASCASCRTDRNNCTFEYIRVKRKEGDREVTKIVKSPWCDPRSTAPAATTVSASVSGRKLPTLLPKSSNCA